MNVPKIFGLENVEIGKNYLEYPIRNIDIIEFYKIVEKNNEIIGVYFDVEKKIISFIVAEKTSDKEESKNKEFIGGFVGDGIVRSCGAVGHDCDECYIKCDLNPMTQEEDDWAFIMEDWDYDPYER